MTETNEAAAAEPEVGDAVEATIRSLKRPATTHIMVEGKIMPASAQPPESALQGAFREGPKETIVIDMKAALPIAQDMVRQARAAAFEKNDAAFMKAQRTGDDKAIEAAKAKGKQLADAPADTRLTKAKTPGALLKAAEDIIAEF